MIKYSLVLAKQTLKKRKKNKEKKRKLNKIEWKTKKQGNRTVLNILRVHDVASLA